MSTVPTHSSFRMPLTGVDRVGQLLDRTLSIPMWQAVSAATAVAVLRGVIDSFTSSRGVFEGLFASCHAPLCYLTMVAALSVVMSACGSIGIGRACRFACVSLPVILLVPVIDLARYGLPFRSSVYFAEQPGVWHFVQSTVLLRPQADVTMGQQVVVATAAVGCALFVWRECGSVVRAACGWLMALVAVYCIGMLPHLSESAFGTSMALLAELSGTGGQSDGAAYGVLGGSEAVHVANYLLLLPLIGLAAAAVDRAGVPREVLRNLRALRLLHYLGMLVAGLVLALRNPLASDAFFASGANLLAAVIAMTSIASLFVGAVWLNDRFDSEIDARSNADRPLVGGRVSSVVSDTVAWLAHLYGLLAAWLLGPGMITVAVAIVAMSWLYSAPPLRIRRYIGVAHLWIGLISALVVQFGYQLFIGELIEPAPWPALIGVVLGMSLLSTAKDVKDAQGDAAAGVTTIMTLLPRRPAAKVTTAAIALGTGLLGFGLIGWNPVLLLGIGASFIAGWIIHRSTRRDRLLLALHVLWVGLLLICLFIGLS